MKTKILGAALLPVIAVAGYFAWPQTSAPVATGAPAPAAEAAPAKAEEPASPAQAVELALALEQKSIVAEFIGNGRERMRLMIMNKGTGPLRVLVPAGQMFEGEERNAVVVVRAGEVEVASGKTRDLVVQTAATRSANTLAETPYQLSYSVVAKLAPLLGRIPAQAELSPGAIQTAVLALAENLPLSAVAKFTLASNTMPSRFNTDAFRAETADVLSALATLRELGVKDAALAMTIDPQLRIEAMIDPASRPLAMNYYKIDPAREWDFWRDELLNGEPCTRHYALYGIARFYPEVALQMLPRWAREKRTNPVYRLSAVQALADTQRPEALALLRELAPELGADTELGKAAKAAGDYLDYRLAQIAATRSTVAFRTSQKREF